MADTNKTLNLLLKVKADNVEAVTKLVAGLKDLGVSSLTTSSSSDKLDKSINKVDVGVGKLIQSARKASDELRRMQETTARQAAAPDVGIGKLVDSARKASAQLRAENEKRVKDQEQAAAKSARIQQRQEQEEERLAERRRRRAEAERRETERAAERSFRRARAEEASFTGFTRRTALRSASPEERVEIGRRAALDRFGTSEERVRQINTLYSEMRVKIKEAADAAAAAGDKLGPNPASLTRVYLMIEAIRALAHALKEATVGAVVYASRTETLGIVTDQLAKANNLAVPVVRGLVEEIKDLGITTQGALDVTNQFIFAQLDLSKALEFARLAQDAAVVAGKDSSTTLFGLIHGIRSQQVEVLRTYGINVNLERIYQEAEKRLGRSISAIEKQQLALNAVLTEGRKITGAYDVAMDTAGKKLTSLNRYVLEAKNAFGRELLPVLGFVVDNLTSLSKWVQTNAATLVLGTQAVAGFGAAVLLFKAGAMIAEIVSLTTAVGGLMASLSAGATALAANPIGLLLVGLAGAVTATLVQIERLKGQYQKAFDIDAEASRTLEETLKRITKEMREGTKTAKDFGQAVRDAIDEARNAANPIGTDRRLSGLSSPDFERNLDFREYVRKNFGQDPDLVKIWVENGNKAGIAIARAMQDAFVEEQKLNFASANPLGIKVVKEEIVDDEKAKKEAQKRLESALEHVRSLERSARLAELDGFQRLAEERRQAIEDYGLTASLLTRINNVFDRMAQTERFTNISKTLGIDPQSLRESANLSEKISKGAIDALARNTRKTAEEAAPDLFAQKIKTGQEAIQEQVDSFERVLGKAISADEAFLRESKKVVEAFHAVSRARVDAALDQARDSARRAEQLVTSSARPGQEVTTARTIAAIRSDLARREHEELVKLADDRLEASLSEAKTEQDKIAARIRFEADGIANNAQLRKSLDDAEFDRRLKIIDLSRRQIEDFRQASGQVFDALTAAGDGGLKKFVEAQVKTVQRTIFQNLAEEGFRASRQFLPTIGGQVNENGDLTLFGRLLRGTPLGIDPEKLALAQNTTETQRNTTALVGLTNAVRLGAAEASTAGLSVVDGLLSGSAATPPFVSNGSTRSGIGGLLGGLRSSTTPGGLFAGLLGGDRSITLGEGRATTASAAGFDKLSTRLGNVIGSGIQTALAGYGVVSGIRRGGAGGFLQATSSGLAIAGQIPGPQQPFVQAASLVTGLLSSIFGSARSEKERYDALVEQSRERNRRQDSARSEVFTDTAGNFVDYDRTGAARVIVINRVNMQVSAMDSKSFVDRSADISTALQRELYSDNPQLAAAIQRTAFA